MVLNDPVVIVGDLKRIDTRAPSSKHEFWRVERGEEAESPPKVDPEVFSIAELIPSDDSATGCEHLIRRAELLNDF